MKSDKELVADGWLAKRGIKEPTPRERVLANLNARLILMGVGKPL